MNIVPNLHFNGECEHAIQLYTQAFGGEVTVFIRFKEVDAHAMAYTLTHAEQEYVYHAEMMIDHQRCMFNDTLTPLQSGSQVSLLLSFTTVEEVTHAYEILKTGATIIQPLQETPYSQCFVSLIDRYGVRWELIQENK